MSTSIIKILTKSNNYDSHNLHNSIHILEHSPYQDNRNAEKRKRNKTSAEAKLRLQKIKNNSLLLAQHTETERLKYL